MTLCEALSFYVCQAFGCFSDAMAAFIQAGRETPICPEKQFAYLLVYLTKQNMFTAAAAIAGAPYLADTDVDMLRVEPLGFGGQRSLPRRKRRRSSDGRDRKSWSYLVGQYFG